MKACTEQRVICPSVVDVAHQVAAIIVMRPFEQPISFNFNFPFNQ
ncbi:hypothetical protein XF_0808 [Xylella fastidiosa 9a5c]|uniref:Uncharacterized protein n=1 Tax=Xylella fastidiosa (strain 9a5c) TaxID=160492 RepID=Q9PF70_XYLFA|nr:hypothetical protein XF_0808 [Xylella fastidiosa 9a5c]